MTITRLVRSHPFLSGTAGAVAVLVMAAILALPGSAPTAAVRDCPPGTSPGEEENYGTAPAEKLPPEYSGPKNILPVWWERECMPTDRAESFGDLALRDREAAAIRTAPFDRVPARANLAAAEERAALEAFRAEVPGAGGTARQYGKGPLVFNDPRYNEVNGSGIVDATGRIDDLKYDRATNQLFAAIGTGGVWLSKDLGKSWRPLTDDLPSTVASAVAYSSAGGPDGTIIVLTGEHTFGSGAYTGIGSFYSRDLGRTWTRSEGTPGGALGFALEVDPADPKIVYAATGKGLWRSSDAGETFKDVSLPTGKCAGEYNDDGCLFSNMVTDVVVKAPKGTGADTEGRDVVAVVGWRAGTAEDPDGFVQSPKNGVYRSPTGAPGSFEFVDTLSTAAGGQERLGRIELGPAVGPDQDHDYLYAIVEDAVLFNGGFRSIDIPEEDPDPLDSGNPTVLNGVYVSSDFGATWIQLANDNEMSDACPANRSVYCIPGLIEPGAQAWYNMWIAPDPTKAAAGIPTRVLLGLEEIWQSRGNALPQNTPATSFEVIGGYYGSVDCLLVATNCAANKEAEVTTTHPDQHAGLMIPTVAEGAQTGEVTLLAGHDGGLSTQVASQVDDFDQASWQLEQKNGLQTLLPYSAVLANDGVAYAGLQDNGTMRVDPADDFRQFETIGADGTFVAVDPKKSDYAFEAIQGGLMNVTIDGGKTWRDVEPPADNKRFVNPFVMDPLDPMHVTTGGRQINETLAGPNTADGTAGNDWRTVFDLGTAKAPEDPPTEDFPEPPSNGMTAIDTRGDVTYVGFCGPCDVLNTPYPFDNGIATNVRGDKPPKAGTPDGWHKVKPTGLPNRYITSLAIDPEDDSGKTVYATLGGYTRRWTPPGSLNDKNNNIGRGHVYKSVNGGVDWADVSSNLPDIPALWVEPRGDQLIVGTDQGVFLSSDDRGDGPWTPLPGIPATPVTSVQLKANDPNVALIATYGRGLWLYEFDQPPLDLPEGGGGEPTLLRPFAKIGISDRTPNKGQKIRLTGRLEACTKNPSDRTKFVGTEIAFKKKTASGFKVIATKRLNDRCRASIYKRVRFDRAVYKISWAAQVNGYKAGASNPKEVVSR